ncbi:hypothetical protein JI721_10180 [Alicyclobacillus cycloheptanicus]|uniref:Bacteriophage HK97-gp10, tail-component n=1 Tax=Alicyclobacillus cycloheptanicus TaxID=1457 RepID=A0ABT9XI24_9BACL|nr:hypothetical protein [Alicyclobacillus cycloheptanicus]MDQ0189968.1 hypothetical protein [Alicyclobacillus cycloheptanicus]WDM00119.1 hypothetical protein JI721_10180 [Alicyclobacillus cycloheptanicus]
MQMNTIIKLGSLAFDVAQDEKIRQLATMVHHGARRRGLLGVPPSAGGSAAKAPEQKAADTAQKAALPKQEKAAEKKVSGRIRIPFEPKPGEPLPWVTDGSMFGIPLGKYFNGGNSTKVMQYAGAIARMLIR